MPVKFTLYSSSSRLEGSSTAEDGSKVKNDVPEPICPSCKKQLSNSILIFRESTASTWRDSFSYISSSCKTLRARHL